MAPTKQQQAVKHLTGELAGIDAEMKDLWERIEQLEDDRETVASTIEIIDRGLLALPGPSGEPQSGVKRAAAVEQPPVEVKPRKRTKAAHMGRHAFRGGACAKNGCGVKGADDSYHDVSTRAGRQQKGRKRAGQASGQSRGSSSSPSGEAAKQEPARKADPALVKKMLGEGETRSPRTTDVPPLAQGEAYRDGKIFHAKQPSGGVGSPCPACKKYPVEATSTGQGQRMYCPGPECEWRQFRLPGEEAA